MGRSRSRGPSAVPSRSSSRRRRPRAMRCSSRRPPRERACLPAGSAVGSCTPQPSVTFLRRLARRERSDARRSSLSAARSGPRGLRRGRLRPGAGVGCGDASPNRPATLDRSRGVDRFRDRGNAFGACSRCAVHTSPGGCRQRRAARCACARSLAGWARQPAARTVGRGTLQPPDTGRAARGGCVQPGGFRRCCCRRGPGAAGRAARGGPPRGRPTCRRGCPGGSSDGARRPEVRVGVQLACGARRRTVADARWREHPAVEALGNVLRSSAFTRRLSLVGGYELPDERRVRCR